MTHREAAERICDITIPVVPNQQKAVAAIIEAHVKEHVEAETKELREASSIRLWGASLFCSRWSDGPWWVVDPEDDILAEAFWDEERNGVRRFATLQDALDALTAARAALAAAPTGKEEGE